MGPICRLAYALGVSDPKRRAIVVLVCKLDASGTDDENPIVTMAGYVGLLTGWLDFEVRAREHFYRYGVDVLHAKKFYDTDGDFEVGRGPRRRPLSANYRIAFWEG
jgi:hypothetical protein